MALPTNYRQISAMKTPTVSYRMSRGTSSIGLNKGEIVAVNPFKSTSQGNPGFNPQKVGGGRGLNMSDNRIPKPPKAPDKPLMPYMRYSRKVWDQVKATNQELKLWEIGKIIGSKWRDLPEADKQDYVDEYEVEKSDYEKALKAYHASPSYQAYLTAKSKSTSLISTDDKDLSAGANPKFDRRIDIQPAEDENDYDESFSIKNVAHARYMRNHRLINEIFSDTTVPDVRTVVTCQRLSVLRRQVQSLTMHQDKLENELKQIEEKFSLKKRKFTDMGKNFQVELKKVKMTAPKLDTEVFNQMIEKQKEILRKEALEKQMKAAAAQSSSTSAEDDSADKTEESKLDHGQESLPEAEKVVEESAISEDPASADDDQSSVQKPDDEASQSSIVEGQSDGTENPTGDRESEEPEQPVQETHQDSNVDA